ncbi:hypothetical protein THAOC_16133 [Thalassiosira oceanica]|uniref:RxLR effector protein n=1 Tax=Thalassiosira oceanica TaxID=159749 RepID=K0SYG3_THAOC|nr:hypothetical protein THAOC_16133 [Thalassiosira oceanica]|eukprot:EJK63227.1 hypothetical protein THAOC_16133 [Thalassiosira oceanica]
MKVLVAAVSALYGASQVSAFAPTRSVVRSQQSVVGVPTSALSMADDDKVFDQEAFIAESKEMRLKYLEDQAVSDPAIGRMRSIDC